MWLDNWFNNYLVPRLLSNDLKLHKLIVSYSLLQISLEVLFSKK